VLADTDAKDMNSTFIEDFQKSERGFVVKRQMSNVIWREQVTFNEMMLMMMVMSPLCTRPTR
jgi:hypothetical protein